MSSFIPVSKFVRLLISVNIAAYLTMLYDKAQSYKNKWRIPRPYIYALVFGGGALSAIIAIYQLRHKTLHEEFIYACFAALCIHVIVIYFFGHILMSI
ncbi:MAG: hypothetical protein BWK80_15000 [Desulfobacteraceae bacterium IS3]|nr:MAG: hypothetical protein BWK80_15000 [Desulfobacteraceae bacterium IS3]